MNAGSGDSYEGINIELNGLRMQCMNHTKERNALHTILNVRLHCATVSRRLAMTSSVEPETDYFRLARSFVQTKVKPLVDGIQESMIQDLSSATGGRVRREVRRLKEPLRLSVRRYRR